MRRFALGLFLVLHGLAHAVVGIREADVQPHPIAGTSDASAVVGTLLFAMAFACFLQGGLGAWGLVGLRRIWRPLVRMAVAASFLLLFLFITPSLRFALGLFLDFTALILADPGISEHSTTTPTTTRD